MKVRFSQFRYEFKERTGQSILFIKLVIIYELIINNFKYQDVNYTYTI